ncbi:MAG: hypothetical protein LLG45_08100 [Actinomycetia bacterium]|nr:hypothetical protein [Actinomycetes bacterium]
MQPALAILSFFGRLVIIVGILFALGLWSPLNILAVCLSFIVVFTILNGVWLYSLATRHGETPPSAKAGGAG